MFGQLMVCGTRAREKTQWLVRATVLCGLFAGPAGLAVADSDDWPIRLRLAQSDSGNRNQRVVTAENLADFPCTKLRLEATIIGGILRSGGGQSPARLVDGKLVYEEIATIPANATYRWTIDFDREASGSTTINAKLEYAEKNVPPPAKPAPKKNCTDYSPSVGAGMTVAEIAFPTGSRLTSALLVHQVMPVEVERKKPYVYQYYVTNISSNVLQNVELVASGFQNLAVSKADPAGQTQGDSIRWTLGDLAECETKVINVTATSAEIGNASACLMATFSNRLCAATKVVEPALKLTKSAPAEALICDEVVMVLTVSNPGSGIARDVKLTDDLPEGLTTSDGKKKLEGSAGNLGPGESKKLTFKVKASKPGSYTNVATARASGDLTAESNKTTTVFRQPVLQIACTAPEERYIGRSAAFNLEIKNTGDAPSAETVVKAAAPSGAEVAAVTKGGSVARGEVTWNLGSLAPGASQTVGFEAKAGQAGVLQVSAAVAGVCAAQVKAACQTKVIGIPAILLEVVDIEDPIEVGKPTTYVITVTNQGTAPGTNIKVVCDISQLSAYVSATGPSPATAAGNRVTFGAIPSLAPKQKVEWRMTVNAVQAGDARLGVEMTSDQFAAPIKETESTNHYK